MIQKNLAGEQGFEPWLAESESAVLPLDDSPISLKAQLSESIPQDQPCIITTCIASLFEKRVLYNNYAR